MMSFTNDGITFVQLKDSQQLDHYLSSFAEAYQKVYSSPPYNEQFYPAEAQSIIEYHINIPDQTTLLAIKDEQVIAFGMACPVQSHPEITRQIRGLLPIKHTYYFAELGVIDPWRRKGLGRKLTTDKLTLVDRSRYQHIVLRTSHNQDAAHHMYQTMGFEDMGVYMEISARRIDGSIRTDQRLFLSRLIDPS